MICRANPFEGKESYIFVSYCHKDKDILYPILEQMVLDGCRVWYDDGNHAGDDWMDNIEAHMENCCVVLAFISGNSSMSHNCKNEIAYALSCNKKVVSVLIDGENLPKGLRMQLSTLHYLKKSDFSSDKTLLNKVYETEEIKLCKAFAGTYNLKPSDSCDNPSGDIPESKVAPFWSRIKPIPGKKIKVKVHEKKPSPSTPPEEKPIDISKPERDEDETDIATPDMDAAVVPPLHGEETLVSTDIDTEVTVLQSRTQAEGDGDVTVCANKRSLSLLLHPARECAYVLEKPQTKIGRSPYRCDVVIGGNDSISKLHAEIIQFKDKCSLCDCNSANGTYVNGDPLDPGVPVPLENPGIFMLNDEILILLRGNLARKYVSRNSISLLINSNSSAICIVDENALPLNRNHKWKDGTLADSKIHREAHALLRKDGDNVFLIDESPNGGNGTYLNERRLSHGESEILSSGDHIRLGDTTLEFVTIVLKE